MHRTVLHINAISEKNLCLSAKSIPLDFRVVFCTHFCLNVIFSARTSLTIFSKVAALHLHPNTSWHPLQYIFLHSMYHFLTDSKSPIYKPSSQELSKMQTCVPSVTNMNEIAACPPSPIADDPSALPSLTSSHSSSQ